jgi:hypothetical protein
MSERWGGFGDRIKRLNPIWMMGRGMNAGPLTEYVQMLGLALLLEVFYRELDNNPQRTRDDLVEIVGSIAHDMGMKEADQDLIQRMVDGYLWYKDAGLQQPYAGTVYDEKKGSFDTHMFRYMKEDRHHSQWDKGGKTVYQLTEEALEIIFMSRELLQELEISIDQMYIQQQMKRGNFRKALRGLDDLLARVRKLIRQEEEYRDDIRRNPKFIFRQGVSLRSKREEEIRGQFEEEKRRFDELMYTLQRLSAASSEEFGRLQEKIDSTRQVHDRLAQLVLGNMSLELELRVKFPHLFWLQSTVSFRRSYWEEWILKDGLPEPDDMESLLAPLFSPQPEFLYPLDWAWEEQDMSHEARQREEENVLEKEEESRAPERVVDWEDIVSLWMPIMKGLIQHEMAPLSALRSISVEQQRHWLRQKEAVDLWLMFYGTELIVPELKPETPYSDDRLVLLQKLSEQDERIRRLEGKTILASIESGQSMIRWEGAVITPFVLHCKEVEH